MSLNPYGRQWFPPSCSESFQKELIDADNLVMSGNCREGLDLYKKISNYNHISKRRLRLAKKQSKKAIEGCNLNEVVISFIDWFAGFEDTRDFILSLFQQANIRTVLGSIDDCDVLVAGCYGNQLQINKDHLSDKLIIFFCGENLSPSYDAHDFSIGTAI